MERGCHDGGSESEGSEVRRGVGRIRQLGVWSSVQGAVVPARMERAGGHSGLRHYGQGTVPDCGGGSGMGPRVGGQDGEGQMR